MIVASSLEKSAKPAVARTVVRPDGSASSYDRMQSQSKAAAALGYTDRMVNSWITDHFIQSYTVLGFRNVHIAELTYDSLSGLWAVDEHYLGSTTFDVNAMSGNGKDNFYIAGFFPGSDFVLEEWTGSPLPPKVIKKREIWRGSLAGPALQVAADPDERFVLVLAGPAPGRALYSFPFAGGGPSVIYDATSLPQISEVRTMQPLQHASLGRVWELASHDPATASLRVILVDGDNDGVFENPPIVGSYTSLEASGVYGPGKWVDTFSGVW